MNLLLAWLLALLSVLQLPGILANTEKVIFTAPEPIGLPGSGPSLDALKLESLCPTAPSLRSSLPVAFPTEQAPHGIDAWFLLQHLNPRQRHELRVCWAAIQPTSFRVDVYNLSRVFDTPELIQSLANHSQTRELHRGQDQYTIDQRERIESVLFLRVQAAADFFTADHRLMTRPPAVDVDIILDPYLVNVIPQSLALTAAYLLLLGVGGFAISGVLWKRLFAPDKQRME